MVKTQFQMQGALVQYLAGVRPHMPLTGAKNKLKNLMKESEMVKKKKKGEGAEKTL